MCLDITHDPQSDVCNVCDYYPCICGTANFQPKAQYEKELEQKNIDRYNRMMGEC